MENEVLAFYLTLCVCISFYEPSVAPSHLIETVFPRNWCHRLMQIREGMTENEVLALYWARCVLLVFTRLWWPHIL